MVVLVFEERFLEFWSREVKRVLVSKGMMFMDVEGEVGEWWSVARWVVRFERRWLI